ncbi:MAG TPA: HD-GYP domain-containing protein [Bacillota bacterium]|jgi:putative nucleotidyltransferase with HDIG domain|nr:HD-GYP domain-containing protein [Bacillota bacterium]HOL10131.1 HD-GYP domain-containing protein [Bacillota bacterium]HPO97873.1 HD-GYP domain-containing protein [Bacillota bacterium]
MSYQKHPFIEITVIGAVILICFLSGAYCGWRVLVKTQIELEMLYIHIVLFLVTIVFLVAFYQKSLASLQNIIEEKYALQKFHLDKLNKISEGTLRALSTALNYRDHGTWGHSARVVGYAVAIGNRIGLDDEQLLLLTWGGFLHDIGKIGVVDSILLKETPLSSDEWEEIRKHPQLGYDIVSKIDFLKEASDIVLHHHERYDGSGYPEGLKGEGISLLARIFAVADALDAMTSDRPYRPAMDLQKALEEITRLAGKQFCPRIVSILKQIGLKELLKIKENINDINYILKLRNDLEQKKADKLMIG